MSESRMMNGVEEEVRIDGGKTVIIEWGPDIPWQISHFVKQGEASMYMVSGVARMLPGSKGEFKLRIMVRTVFTVVKNKANGELLEVGWEPEEREKHGKKVVKNKGNGELWEVGWKPGEREKLENKGQIVPPTVFNCYVSNLNQPSHRAFENQRNVISLQNIPSDIIVGNMIQSG